MASTPSVNFNPDNAEIFLRSLANLSRQSATSFKVTETISQGEYTYNLERIGIIARLYRWIFGVPYNSDYLKALKPFFERLLVTVNTDEALKKRYQSLVWPAFKGIESLYRRYQNDSSVAGMIERNDLLEALSVAYRDGDNFDKALDLPNNLRMKRIQVPLPSGCTEPFKAGEIPLVPYSQMEAAVKQLEEVEQKEKATGESHKAKTLEDLQAVLGSHLIKEEVPFGKWIDRIYGHLFPPDAINKVVTNAMGSKSATIRSVCKFLHRMKIPVESVEPVEKDGEQYGELYAYSEMYGTSLRDAKTHDEVFCRRLVSAKREKLEQVFQKKLEEIREQFANQGNTLQGANSVITGVYGRVMHHFIEPQKFGQRFNITGKLFKASKGNRHAAYVNNAFGDFGVSGLGVFTMPKKIRDVNPIQDKLLRKVLAPVLNYDPDGVHMFVKRLAPGDLHCFEMPVAGQILTQAEACKELKTLIEEQEQVRQTGNYPELSDAQKKEYSEIKQHLNDLIKYFEIDGDNRNIIYIPGTVASVSPNATQYHSQIYATNSRMPVMIRGTDGRLSVHVLIGATGVNNLQVSDTRRNANAGATFGRMGIGGQQKQEDKGVSMEPPGLVPSFKKSELGNPKIYSRTNGTGVKMELPIGKKAALGTSLGAFELGGSCIISLHLKRHIRVISALEKYAEKVSYQKIIPISLWTRFFNLFRKQPIVPAIIDKKIEVQCSPRDVIAMTTPLGLSVNATRRAESTGSNISSGSSLSDDV